MKEELPGIKLTCFRFYNDFRGSTPHTGDKLQARVYFAEMVQEFSGTANEINELFGQGRGKRMTSPTSRRRLSPRSAGTSISTS